MEDINRALKEMKFYNVILFNENKASSAMVICTYRPKEAVENIFRDIDKGLTKADVWEMPIEHMLAGVISKDHFPVFCVELNCEYKDLMSLAEDIMISRISGIIDKEMVGM